MVPLFLPSIIPAFLIKIWRRQDPAQVEYTIFFKREAKGLSVEQLGAV